MWTGTRVRAACVFGQFRIISRPIHRDDSTYLSCREKKNKRVCTRARAQGGSFLHCYTIYEKKEKGAKGIGKGEKIHSLEFVDDDCTGCRRRIVFCFFSLSRIKDKTVHGTNVVMFLESAVLYAVILLSFSINNNYVYRRHHSLPSFLLRYGRASGS